MLLNIPQPFAFHVLKIYQFVVFVQDVRFRAGCRFWTEISQKTSKTLINRVFVNFMSEMHEAAPRRGLGAGDVFCCHERVRAM